MKKLTSIIFILFLSLLSSPSWSESLVCKYTGLFCPSIDLSIELDDLVEREGLSYKKFSKVPFTGEITGKTQGLIKDGKYEGAWVSYHDNGQLKSKVKYKDGKAVGEWVYYNKDGTIKSKKTYLKKH